MLIESQGKNVLIFMRREGYRYFLRLVDDSSSKSKRGDIRLLDPKLKNIKLDKERRVQFIEELIAAGKKELKIQEELVKLNIVKDSIGLRR